MHMYSVPESWSIPTFHSHDNDVVNNDILFYQAQILQKRGGEEEVP